MTEKTAAEDTIGYLDLFRYAPIGIVRTSLEGQLLAGNQAFAEILGYADFDEFVTIAGYWITDLYENPELRKRLIAHHFASSVPMHFETRLRKKDGSFCFCRLHVRASTDSFGRASHFEAFIEDISHQKEIDAALKASARRYRSVFENTGTATIIIEKDTTISLANDRVVELTGYSRNEIEGKMKWPVLIAHPAELTRMLKYHEERRYSPSTTPLEYEFTLKDRKGQLKEVFLRVDLINGCDASVASMLDITSLKNTRRSLLESESRLTGILATFDGLIYIASLDYKLLFMNGRLRETLQKGDAIGVSSEYDQLLCYQHLYGRKAPCPWCEIARVFRGETVRKEFHHPLDERWYYSVSSPIYEEETKVSQQQTVMLDIHQRRLQEEQLREREQFLEKENVRLRENIGERYKFGSIIGKSAVMQKVYGLIVKAAGSSANVIIYGESGTGKELVARAIHDMSDRKDQPFVAVNCGAIPSELMESEFFGYRKGAFTGADRDKPGLLRSAGEGTLFLDELGEISESMQIKLLRVLDGYGYSPLGAMDTLQCHARIITATNRNLRSLLDQGRMREDFFYRIHIIPLSLPPLRERREDIPLLIEHFMEQYEQERTVTLSGRDVERLVQHNWPGNVRELENTIQRYLYLGVLEFSGRGGADLDTKGTGHSLELSKVTGLSLKEACRCFERELLMEHLQAARWNRTRVAEKLSIQRKTLYLKMQALGIDETAG